MKRERIEWNWWGTWLIDYCCAQDAYDAYDIWGRCLFGSSPSFNGCTRKPHSGRCLRRTRYNFRFGHESLQPITTTFLGFVGVSCLGNLALAAKCNSSNSLDN